MTTIFIQQRQGRAKSQSRSHKGRDIVRPDLYKHVLDIPLSMLEQLTDATRAFISLQRPVVASAARARSDCKYRTPKTTRSTEECYLPECDAV
jgi:hypothetical protein